MKKSNWKNKWKRRTTTNEEQQTNEQQQINKWTTNNEKQHTNEEQQMNNNKRRTTEEWQIKWMKNIIGQQMKNIMKNNKWRTIQWTTNEDDKEKQQKVKNHQAN